jgi:hypothetical protein
LTILEKLFPDSYKIFPISQKTAYSSVFFLNHPLIDKIHITEKYEALGQNDVEIIKNCKAFIHPFPQHPPCPGLSVGIDNFWYNEYDCVEETIRMANISKNQFDLLSEEEIVEISNNKYFGLTQDFGNYKSSEHIKLCYDTKFIKDYKLIDLSGKGNDGRITNCEIVGYLLDDTKLITIPHRRKSVFKSLKHEENGFLGNKWKDEATRWNQLRFHNEVSTSEDIIYKDGLNDLLFVEHGKFKTKKITQINVGI